MLRGESTCAAVLPRRCHERNGRRQHRAQTEGKSLRGRGRKGNLPRLNTKIFGETGSRIIKDRSRSSRLSVPAIWIANAGAIEIGHQIHDHWERR